MGLLFWKIENKTARLVIAFVAIAFFAVNPVRFKQQGVSSLERFSGESAPLPEKVVFETPKFHERQRAEMDKLKKESLEVLNAEID